MLRRDFLRRSASSLAATWVASKAHAAGLAIPAVSGKYRAHDDVVLGRTGIRTSRLAMGTGTIGGGGESNQTRLGTSPFVTLLLDGYHENGLRFFDTADSYGSHPYVASAIKQLPRDKVTVLTKTDHRDPKDVRNDLDRFRRELGTDYIDIVLIHCTTERDWTTRRAKVWRKLFVVMRPKRFACPARTSSADLCHQYKTKSADSGTAR